MEIKTSEEKFQIIPIAQLKTKKNIVNNKEIETSKSGKLLGLNISVTGLVGHISRTIKKGNGILTQLRRFSKLSAKVKTTLIKTLLIPVMDYPPIPLCMTSRSQERKMQTVLNKALRFIHCSEEAQLNSEQLHIKYGITPLNTSILYKAQKVWNTIKISENEQYNDAA